jgi:hypothetical protein
MDGMSAFERQVADGLQHLAGPGRRIDAVAMAHTAASVSPKGRVLSMLTATRLIVAGAIVALFGGFLLVGAPPTTPPEREAPGALTTAAPSPIRTAGPSVVPDASAAALESGPPLYEAIARLGVQPGPDPSVQDLELAARAATRYAAQALSAPVLGAVIAELGLTETVEHLRGRIEADSVEETFEVTIAARDEDPAAAQALATAIAEELRQRVMDVLGTDEVIWAERALHQARQQVGDLQSRLDRLRRKGNRTQLEQIELNDLPGQISDQQLVIRDLARGLSGSMRNRLELLERPTLPDDPVEPSGPGGPQRTATPTRDVVVADRMIEQGTSIGPDMLILVTVPMDATNEMAFTDIGSAVGKVAAIDILENQPVTPNMLIAE